MTRRATIRTAHAEPETIAAALAPDNTDEMATRVEPAGDDTAATDAGDRVVVTTIERDATSGLQATVDDTLVNLAVADQVVSLARDEPDTRPTSGTESTSGAESPTEAESTADQPTTDTNDTL
ncbi:hypothetical protein C479_04527 [Halovivax asiaticus JCM 14624]|uniref:KEOPS complex Pcc1-like subunit n=1 Tax=Halovivax asiaticus JCM 14624 TaxID=1227490 RepID=M0BR93_9EURY|nr:KEOPS complex subunit Pcc1 [Halovivax asiaticus]ELZ12632.1 hypothetical protein C479_04527 [Halovivax asiaticus JCM 14624]